MDIVVVAVLPLIAVAVHLHIAAAALPLTGAIVAHQIVAMAEVDHQTDEADHQIDEADPLDVLAQTLVIKLKFKLTALYHSKPLKPTRFTAKCERK